MICIVFSQAKVAVHQGGLLVREQAVAMERVSRVSRILLFIPVLFVLLRVWAVVQFLYISYLSHLTDESGRCIPTDPYKTIHVALGVLQVSYDCTYNKVIIMTYACIVSTALAYSSIPGRTSLRLAKEASTAHASY